MRSGQGGYSRAVAVLKVGLPLVALALLSSLFLTPGDRPSDGGGLVFSPGDVDVLGSGLAIRNPTFSGTTQGQDRYRFTAALVEPDAAPPTRAEITTLDGDIEFHGGPTVTVRAARGDLDVPTQRMVLTGDVDIGTSEGYRIRTDRATLDLRAGSLVAGDAVESTGPLGRIDSGTLSVAPAASAGEARRFSFGNGVKLLYDPSDPG